MAMGSDAIRWGFDDAGNPGRLDTLPWASAAMEEFGFDLWSHHYHPLKSIQENTTAIREIDAWCRERQITWLMNVEDANWKAGFVDENGMDWYNHADGRHYFLLPEALLSALAECECLGGLLYDEVAHMQNAANVMAEGIDMPWVYDPSAAP